MNEASIADFSRGRFVFSCASVLALAALFAAAHPTLSRAGEYSAEVNYSFDSDRDITNEGSTSSKSHEEKLTTSYSHKTKYELEWSLDYDVTWKRDIKEGDFDPYSDDQTLKGELKAAWWSASSEWGRKVDHTDDPEVAAVRDESVSLEVKAEPESDLLPDLAFSCDRGKDSTDVSYEGSMEYKLADDLVTVSLDAKKDVSKPRNPEEDATDDRSLEASMKVSRDISKKIKVEGELKHTRDQSLTLDNGFRLINKTDTLSNEAKGKIDYKPLDWWEFALTQENSWDKDFMVEGQTDRNTKWESSTAMKPKIGEFIEPEIDYKNTVEIKSGTDADSKIYSQEATAQVSYKPLKIVEFTGSYDWSREDDRPESESNTSKRTDEYKLEGKWKIWSEQIELTASRAFTYDWENDKHTTTSIDWDFESSITLKEFPNLEISPTYKISDDGSTKEENLEIQITHEIKLGNVTSFKTEHKYTRTHTAPAEDIAYISRDDDTKFTLELKDFLKNMTFSTDYERKASDESENDTPPELSYSLNFKYSWKALGIYELTFEHGYERSTDDKKTYDASISFPLHKDHFKFKFEYGFETQLTGEKNDSETYAVELNGKF